MKKAITPETFYKKMLELSKTSYVEDRHIAMDDLLCEVLSSLGYEKGVNVFYNADKWYA